jgi:hypothetical protein
MPLVETVEKIQNRYEYNKNTWYWYWYILVFTSSTASMLAPFFNKVSTISSFLPPAAA